MVAGQGSGPGRECKGDNVMIWKFYIPSKWGRRANERGLRPSKRVLRPSERGLRAT